MTHRMNLRSRNVYYRGDFRDLEVGIDKGKIAEVGEDVDRAKEELDLGDSLLLPGAIDGHVHFRDPGNPEKEDFRSGSRAAVRGGVTTVMDMPNNNPPIKTPSLFRKKVRIAKEKSLVNFGLYAGIPNDLNLIEPMWSEGAIGFKLYMAEEDKDLEELAVKLDEIDALLTGHAEDKVVLDNAVSPSNPEEYLKSRPAEAEITAVKKLSSLPLARLHLAHVTLPESLSMIERRITTEITPHHLLLSREDVDLSNFVPVCNPPLRSRSKVEKIQKRFVLGEIDFIASDHAPHQRKEKVTSDPGKASAGVPGVETILPISLTFAQNNNVPLWFVVEKLTGRPAEVFGFEKRGEIREGYWADLTVLDGSHSRKIKGEEFYSNAKLTPFEGYEVSFWPTMTLVNGEVKYREGQIVKGEKGEFLSGGRHD